MKKCRGEYGFLLGYGGSTVICALRGGFKYVFCHYGIK